MTSKNHTPYLRLTPVDVKYLVELFEQIDRRVHSEQLYDFCRVATFGKLMIQMDDFLIKAERKKKE